MTEIEACAKEMLEALESIGASFKQHNLLSTATDSERKEAIRRIITAWNEKAVPILERLVL